MSLKAKLEEIASGEFTDGIIAFSDSFLGDEGCTILALALQNNSNVTSLDLRGCNIRSEGASSLAQLLSVNTTLVTLGLEWNGIGMIESGIQTLCKVDLQHKINENGRFEAAASRADISHGYVSQGGCLDSASRASAQNLLL